MDQVQIEQAAPEPGLEERYWNKWYCSNGSLYLQRDGSWDRSRFYFDTKRQIQEILEKRTSTHNVSSAPDVFSGSDDDFGGGIDLGGGGGGGIDLGGGGGDFGGGGGGGDW